MGNVPKSEETGVPVTAKASKAEEGTARRVSVPSTPANDDVLVGVEQMP